MFCRCKTRQQQCKPKYMNFKSSYENCLTLNFLIWTKINLMKNIYGAHERDITFSFIDGSMKTRYTDTNLTEFYLYLTHSSRVDTVPSSWSFRFSSKHLNTKVKPNGITIKQFRRWFIHFDLHAVVKSWN